MGATPLHKRTIPAGIFTDLLRSSQCDTGDDLGTIGFTANYMNWHMNFYGCLDADHAIVVEDFGREISGDWQQMVPTAEQLAQLQKIIYAKAREIEDAQRQERTSEVSGDWNGWGEMTQTYRFIESNFYSKY